MFTLEQLDAIHESLGNAETFLGYVQALKAIGVERYESFLADGHSEYLGADGHIVRTPAAHETLVIAETSARDSFLDHLRRHESGETSYLEMSQGLAESGIEKWSVDTNAMTMIYSDKAGEALLVEEIT